MEVDKTKLHFFRSTAALRTWFEKNGSKSDEIWVGFYKKDSGKSGITYAEALDEALCFGWIDGIRKSLDDVSYVNRFTPRRARSVWSRVNIAKVKALIDAGRMTRAGLAEYEKRSGEATAPYSFEQDKVQFSPKQEKEFRSNRPAWKFFESQPPYYRRVATWWVTSAKREETQARRLERLIDESLAGRRIGSLATATKKGP